MHIGEKIRKMARAFNELSTELERELTDEEVAGRLSWNVDRIKDVKTTIPDTISLNHPLSSNVGSSELGDLVKDEREPEESVGRLPERQRRVLVRYYGLDGEKPATLADLSEKLAVSRERVRQLQRETGRALREEGEYGQELPVAA